jgi:hypothetical protein
MFVAWISVRLNQVCAPIAEIETTGGSVKVCIEFKLGGIGASEVLNHVKAGAAAVVKHEAV